MTANDSPGRTDPPPPPGSGRGPVTPPAHDGRLPPAILPLGRRLMQAGRKTVLRIISDDGMEIAGYMAFMGLLALFPFLIFLTALAGIFGRADEAGEGIDALIDMMPPEIASALTPVAEEVVSGATGGILTFGAIATLWTASSGVEALRGALNRAYGCVVTRPIWLRRLQSMLVVVTFGLMIVILSVLYVLGPVIWEAAQTWLPRLLPDMALLPGRGGPPDAGFRDLPIVAAVSTLLSGWLPTLTTGILVFVLVLVLHRVLPNSGNERFRHWPGALFTTVCWMAAGSLFSIYLQNMANMNVTYGSLGALVAALLYFYMSSLLFLMGGYVNAAISEVFPKPARAARS